MMTIAFLATVVLLGTAGVVHALEPTVTDIALCNEQAQTHTGPPSALPGPGSPPRRARDTTRPGDETRAREETDPSGALINRSSDPLLLGMDASKREDAEYRTVYRECMRRRLERSR